MNPWGPKTAMVLGLVIVSTLIASARAVRPWSDAELEKAADLIVIGRPIAVKDLDETNALGFTSSPTFQSRFRGVETTFEISKVIQGKPEQNRIVLHHYHEEPEWGSPPNGPTLIRFTPNASGEFLLYLVKDGTDRYAPVAGQMDAGLSIKSLPSTLELTIQTPKNIVKSSEGIPFTISFHNRGANDLLLNGGALLGNGSEIWSSLEAELKTDTGQPIPMSLGWGVPGVAGRIYFLGIPLRAGSSYQLFVSSRDYFVGNGERLKPGSYQIHFIYHGRQSPYRDSTQLPACWEGELHSNPLSIQVLAD
jgi:hypothetical protein